MNPRKPLASLLCLALVLGSFPTGALAANLAAAVRSAPGAGTGVFSGLNPGQVTQFATTLTSLVQTLPLSGVAVTGGANLVPAAGAVATPVAAASAVETLTRQAFAPGAAARPIEARANAALLAAVWAEPRVSAELASSLDALGTPEGASAAAAVREAVRVFAPGLKGQRTRLKKELAGLRKLDKLGSVDGLFDGKGVFAGLKVEPQGSETAVAADAAIGGPKVDAPLRRADAARLSAARDGRFVRSGVITVEKPVDLPLYRPTAEGQAKPSITTRWIPQAQAKGDRASRVLLANYAPTADDLATFNEDALTQLRVTTREDSLGLYAELRALPGVESGPAAETVAALRQQLLDGDTMGAMRSVAAISAAYGPTTVAVTDAAPAETGLRADVQERLEGIYGLQLALKSAVDHLKMSADGMGRTAVHYWTPQELRSEMLRRDWGERKLKGEPVVDAVVVGGGPSGLAAAYYLSESNGSGDAGLRTVLIEGGYVGQAFSDGGAPSVHWLRTGRWTTSLATTGAAPARHVAQIGLPRVSEFLGFKPKGQAARADVEARGGGKYIGRSREERKLARFRESKNWLVRAYGFLNGLFFYAIRERIMPIARNEIWQYFNHVGSHIAENPNAIVLEQSPVASWSKRADGLWEVRTAQGHLIVARRLVVGTGIVGTDADFAQIPKEFQALQEQSPGAYLSVGSFPELGRKAGELSAMFNERARTGHYDRQFLFTGTLLRTPEAQRWLKSLPSGSRVGVIGSGESAAKDVVDILIQNPQLKVAIFAKSQFEPAQVQVPETYFTPELAKRGIVDKDFAKFSVDQWKRVFGTPITPQTMLDMLTAQKEGRVEVYELGKHFTDAMMTLAHRPGIAGGGTEVEITDTEVVANLVEQKRVWAEKYGLNLEIGEHMGPGGTHLRIPLIDGGWVFSTGFAAGKTRATPLMQQLIDGGHVRLNEGADLAKWYKGQVLVDEKNHISSAADPTLAFTGISFYNPAGDSTIAGMGVRGRYIGDYMKKSLREEALAEGRDSRGSATMGVLTLDRLGKLPTYDRLPGTQRSYASTPRANPVTLDPSLALLEILPWPILSTVVLMLTGTASLEWITMLAIPATLIPGLSRWMPYYKQLFRRPIDVIVRRADVRRSMGLPQPGVDRLLVDRAHQLEDRQALPLDRFHFFESIAAIVGLISSFRWYKPWAIERRADPAPQAAPRGDPASAPR
jgi:hypothetical protein